MHTVVIILHIRTVIIILHIRTIIITQVMTIVTIVLLMDTTINMKIDSKRNQEFE